MYPAAAAVEQTTSTPEGAPVEREALFSLMPREALLYPVRSWLPVAGVVYNVDYALGQSGINGIKTGSNPGSGAGFMFASTFKLAGQNLTLVGYELDCNAAPCAAIATQ